MVRYFVDPADNTIRLKTYTALPTPEGLVLVEQEEDIPLALAIYSPRTKSVLQKTPELVAREIEDEKKKIEAAETEHGAQVAELHEAVAAIKDTKTRSAIQKLVALLKI